MLPYNIFLQALEAQSKGERFKILCDTEKIKPDTLARAEKDYSWLVGKMINRFKMPSMSEMQTLTNMLHRMIPATHEFETGFKGLGDEELYRKH